MPIAPTLKSSLERHGFQYELVSHPHTSSTQRAAQAAHVSGDKLLKSVLLGDEQGLVMVVLPATHRVDLGVLHKRLKRELGLVTEEELTRAISDCEPGALPPIGPDYGIETLVDVSIDALDEVYFEAGDHRELVHMEGAGFRRLLARAERLHLSHHL